MQDGPANSRKEAKLLGTTTYFTGKACPAGHVALRKTSNGECRECARLFMSGPGGKAASQRWRNKNQDHDARYYALNKDNVRDRQRIYYHANRSRLIKAASERDRLYHDEFLARQKAWKKANPGALKSWRRSNPLSVTKHLNNRRSRQVGAEGWHTADDLKELFTRQNGRCYWCNNDIAGRATLEHLIPLSRGGSNWPDNLALACRSCNSKKGRLLPDEFRNSLQVWSTG